MLRIIAAHAFFCSPLSHRSLHIFPLVTRCTAIAAAVHSARFCSVERYISNAYGFAIYVRFPIHLVLGFSRF